MVLNENMALLRNWPLRIASITAKLRWDLRPGSVCFFTKLSHKRVKDIRERNLLLYTDNNRPYPLIYFREYAKGFGGKKPKGSKHRAHLSDEEMMDVIDVRLYRDQLQSVINKMKADFIANLSLRTSVGSIENLEIEIEGDKYSLNELAQISRKNPTLVVINMSAFPEGLKPTIEAINLSGLGLNPQQEGTMIYLQIPKVTREHREKLAKNAKSLYLKAKEDIRDVQNHFVKEAKQRTDISEDIVFSTQQQLVEIAEDYAREAEKMMKAKQKDLLGDES